MQSFVLQIRATETPRVLRPCSGCGRLSHFVSSDRFRVNAQQKSLDVWLIYRCINCKSTWNLTVHSRVNPRQLPKDTLSSYHENDRQSAWNVAFDKAIIERAGGVIDFDVSVEFEKRYLESSEGTMRIECVHPLNLRLDRALSSALSLSRSSIQKLAKKGQIICEGQKTLRALRKPVIDGQKVKLVLQGMDGHHH